MKVDPVSIQVSLRTRLRPTRAQAQAALDEWTRTGRAPRGYRIALVRWRNPGRAKVSGRRWREARTLPEIRQAWGTLFARGLPAPQIRIAGPAPRLSLESGRVPALRRGQRAGK